MSSVTKNFLAVMNYYSMYLLIKQRKALYIIAFEMDKKIDLQKQVYFLAVPNHLDATLFLKKRAKIGDYLLFFKKIFMFDKFLFVQIFLFLVQINHFINIICSYIDRILYV